MKKHWVPLFLGACMSLPALAQQGDRPQQDSARAAAESRQSPGPEQPGGERDELATRAQRAMEELRALAEELKKRADKASAEARTALEHQLKALQEEQKKLEKKLRELQDATAREWKELRDEIERAIERFNRPPPKPQRDAI